LPIRLASSTVEPEEPPGKPELRWLIYDEAGAEIAWIPLHPFEE
jgi:hypothetical protein